MKGSLSCYWFDCGTLIVSKQFLQIKIQPFASKAYIDYLKTIPMKPLLMMVETNRRDIITGKTRLCEFGKKLRLMQ